MSDTLAVEIQAGLRWLFEEALDLSTLTDASQLEFQAALADGTGEGQADRIWHDERTLAAAANDDLDLTALVQTIHGGAVNIGFAKVKAILIVNLAATAGEDLRLDSSVANSVLTPFAGSATSKLAIPADSPLLLVNRKAGWAVTAGTGDILRITNDGTWSVTYRIVIVGTSA